jgi:hypothetical protein
MNHSLNIFLISDDAIMIKGYYVGDFDAHTKNTPRRQLFDFKCRDKSISPGDMVIVEVNHRARDYGLLIVDKVDIPVDFNQTHDYKWVIQKIDIDAFIEVKEREEELIELVREREVGNRRDAMRQALGITEVLSLTGTSLVEEAPKPKAKRSRRVAS